MKVTENLKKLVDTFYSINGQNPIQVLIGEGTKKDLYSELSNLPERDFEKEPNDPVGIFGGKQYFGMEVIWVDEFDYLWVR